MKYFAIGDTHGCNVHLNMLLETIAPEIGKDDKLIFLGDYVDRGPDSKGVIDTVMKMQSQMGERCIALMGNHEDEMIAEKPNCPVLMGGDATWKSFGLSPDEAKIPTPYYDWMESLALFHKTDDFFFCHAGADISIPLDEQKRNVLLWSRYEEDIDAGIQRIIHGHTPAGGVFHGHHRTNLDCGAVFGGYLACGIFEAGDRDGIRIVAVDKHMNVVRDGNRK